LLTDLFKGVKLFLDGEGNTIFERLIMKTLRKQLINYEQSAKLRLDLVKEDLKIENVSSQAIMYYLGSLIHEEEYFSLITGLIDAFDNAAIAGKESLKHFFLDLIIVTNDTMCEAGTYEDDEMSMMAQEYKRGAKKDFIRTLRNLEFHSDEVDF